MQKVKLAMEENPNDNLAKRMEHAANNSWRKRVEKLEGIVEDFMDGKPV
jgi:hypothetical protein